MPQNVSNKTVSETCDSTKITKAKSPRGKYLTENIYIFFFKLQYFSQVKISSEQQRHDKELLKHTSRAASKVMASLEKHGFSSRPEAQLQYKAT